jgi:hypothetical protein
MVFMVVEVVTPDNASSTERAGTKARFGVTKLTIEIEHHKNSFSVNIFSYGDGAERRFPPLKSRQIVYFRNIII